MAENDNKSIFREKSLEQVESPEKLNDYLRVTSPAVWLILGSVIAILIGVCIWGIFGRIDATTSAAVVAADGKTVCYVPASALEGVIDNKTVTVDGRSMEMTPSVLEPVMVTQEMDVYVMLAGNLAIGDIVYPIEVTEALPDGVYTGAVLTETLSPMSLFFG